MAMTVTLDGTTFYSEPDPVLYPSPVTFKLTNIDGWYDSPTVSTTIVTMPLADGAFAPARSYRGPRSISVEGVCYGQDVPTVIEYAWQQIAAFSTGGLQMSLTVQDELDTKRATVWLSGAPQVRPFAPGKAKWQIPLIASDPRKYATDVSRTFIAPSGAAADGLQFPLGDASIGYLYFGAFIVTGTTTLANNGTAETWPEFQVQGPIDASGFSIVADTQTRITYVGAIAQGDSIRLLPYAGGRAVTSAGADVTNKLTVANWPSITPGGTRTFQFLALGAVSGNAGLTATVADAWW